MKINLEVQVSEAMAIAYALRELANRRRQHALERGTKWGVDSADELDTLSGRIEVEARNQQPH